MKKVTFILLLHLLTTGAFGIKAQQTVRAEQTGEAEKLITELLTKYPGLSIAVGIEGQLVWSKGFGYSDVTKNIPVSESTLFRYYSLSKSITGIALAKLVNSGNLDISKAVRTYLPNLPEHYKDVTVQQLIGHTAGVRHYEKGEWMKISKSHCSTADQSFSTFINDPLNHTPGSVYEYSTFGYVILSALIEQLSKSSFNDFINQEVFLPIGITNIGVDQVERSLTNQSVYYEAWKNGKAKIAAEVDNSCKMGGGGLVGDAKSLALIHLELMNGKLLSAEEKELYFRALPNAGGSPRYSFGLTIVETGNETYFSHSGSGLGGNSAILIRPKRKAVIVLLGNIEDNAMNAVAGKLLKIFIDETK